MDCFEHIYVWNKCSRSSSLMEVNAFGVVDVDVKGSMFLDQIIPGFCRTSWRYKNFPKNYSDPCIQTHHAMMNYGNHTISLQGVVFYVPSFLS